MRRAFACGFALCVAAAAWAGCGGTSGRDGPSTVTPDGSSGDDAAVGDGAATEGEAGVDATQATPPDADDGTFDVVILYADRVLPDVSPPPEAGPDVHESGAPDAGRKDAGPSPCPMFNTPLSPEAGVVYDCTPTEQKFVDKSVDCYMCLINGACLDDALFGDLNNECEDIVGNALNGDGRGTAKSDLCLANVDCVIATSCASSDIAACYCGSLAGSACGTSQSPADGVCVGPQAAGVERFATDPASVVSPLLGNKNSASGKADSIFACSIGNGCVDLCNK